MCALPWEILAKITTYEPRLGSTCHELRRAYRRDFDLIVSRGLSLATRPESYAGGMFSMDIGAAAFIDQHDWARRLFSISIRPGFVVCTKFDPINGKYIHVEVKQKKHCEYTHYLLWALRSVRVDHIMDELVTNCRIIYQILTNPDEITAARLNIWVNNVLIYLDSALVDCVARYMADFTTFVVPVELLGLPD
jgi:hypothetical protein